jgi:hypothetical protein
MGKELEDAVRAKLPNAKLGQVIPFFLTYISPLLRVKVIVKFSII